VSFHNTLQIAHKLYFGDARGIAVAAGSACSEYIAVGTWLSLLIPYSQEAYATNLTSQQLDPEVGKYLRAFHARAVTAAIARYGDQPQDPGKILIENRPVAFENNNMRRFRGIRTGVEIAVVEVLEHELSSDNVHKVQFGGKGSALTIADQFHHIRSSACVVGPEGSFFTWMLFSRPGTVWVMVNDHWRSVTRASTSMFYVPIAVYLCGLRLVVIEVIYDVMAPQAHWGQFVSLNGTTSSILSVKPWFGVVDCTLTRLRGMASAPRATVQKHARNTKSWSNRMRTSVCPPDGGT
jgi:hypothetical protein